MIIKRSDIFLLNLEPVLGSEQGGTRPCLVVQNNVLNQHSPNTIILPFTSNIPDKNYPHAVTVSPAESGLKKESVALSNQIRTVSKDRLLRKVGALSPAAMKRVDAALKLGLALD